MNGKELVCLAAKYADDKKAENIKIIDLGGMSSLCDYILIATATSKPHLDSIEEEISTQLKKEGIYKSNRDGGDSSMWRVSDYGSFLVHIMTQDARDFYSLDKIFSFGTDIDFKEPKKAAPKAKKVAVKKAPAKKPAAKKTPVKKTVAKTTVKKSAAVKKTVKAAPKAAAKKATPKAAPKKAAAKKTVKVVAKKPAVKKAPTKKTVAKKTTVKKSTVKKAVKKAAKK